MNVALTRAKLCELLAQQRGEERTERPFTVGLLSVLDAVLDRPMDEVIDLLPLSEDINAALLAHDGELGNILSAVLEYEASVAKGTELSPPTPSYPRPTANDYLTAV